LRFFFDNCVSPKLARAIHALVEPITTVQHLVDLYPAANRESVADLVWIKRLADEGDWVIVSGDLRITTLAHERSAWKESGLTAFFQRKGWTKQDKWMQVRHLVRWWPDIQSFASNAQKGLGWLIPSGQGSGKFEVIK
jgi:hypothetical protein